MRALWTLVLGALVLGAPASRSVAAPFPSFEAYLRFLGDAPSDHEADWTDNVQGIGHDETHWYITKKDRLYRAPGAESLARDLEGEPGVSVVHIDDVFGLAAAGYEHFGDLSTHPSGYVLVGTDSGDEDGVMAVFRADASLEYLSRWFFPGQGVHAGWVAIDPDGFVYSSVSNTSTVRKYAVDWDAVETIAAGTLAHVETIDLQFSNGSPMFLGAMQGGVISPSGRLLYLANGASCESENPGLHVIDLETGRAVTHSCRGGCLFDYDFDLCQSFGTDEPEGITIWDLDGPLGGSMEGQLHALVLNNDPISSNAWLKHYTVNVHVAPGGDGNGTPTDPFGDVGPAADLAWNGSVILIDAGTYSAGVTIDKQVRLESGGGVVRIGTE